MSVVVPVYRGEDTLPRLIEELAALHEPQVTPAGRPFRVSEVLLVWDRGPGRSDEVIRELHAKHDWVRPVWLSRNFGQHAATLAGMTSSGGEWIVTMDEDGQQDPAFIGAMLDRAYETGAQLVYGQPTNPPPHGALRNAGSKLAKGIFVRFLADQKFEEFNSLPPRARRGRPQRRRLHRHRRLPRRRAVVGRRRRDHLPGDRPRRGAAGRQLQLHAASSPTSADWSISSGTKPLFFVTFIGIAFVIIGGLAALWVAYERIVGDLPVSGWASMFIALMVVGGAVMLSLGIIAQYIGAATNMSLGKPLYVVVRDPAGTFGDQDDARS